MKDIFKTSHAAGGKGANASASATKSYHNGGVEGGAFADWYDTNLADKFAETTDSDATGSGSGGTKGSGSGGTKGSGSGGTKGSGSGGTKGSGSGGTKGSDKDDDKGSGSGGTKGSGSGGTKGSDKGDDKGSGSGGTKGEDKGSGSGGTKGSGSGGTKGDDKGSGSGGTKGSDKDDDKGSGSGGTQGSECEPEETTGKPTQTYTMGTDPAVTITVTETPTGTLFFDVNSAQSADGPVDVSGVFFNLTDDSSLDSLVFYPDANQGGVYDPITGIQIAVDAVNTLADGSTVPGQFDAAVQFGTEADSTNGLVQSAKFTLWSLDGPLSFEDIDLDGMSVVVDSEAQAGQVLDVTQGPDGADAPDDADCEGSGGTKGSGSGGTKGSDDDDDKGSGSGGTNGSDSPKWASDPVGELPAFDASPDDQTAQDDEEDVVYASGSGGTSGSGGSAGTGGGSGPGLQDIMALMTQFPDDDSPTPGEDENPWTEDDPDLFV